MNGNIILLARIERGTQVGLDYNFLIGNEVCWSSVALQKWEGKYKVFIDEILESKMDSEEYLRDDLLSFNTADDALNFIKDNTTIEINDLLPCKGQKIFDPKCDC